MVKEYRHRAQRNKILFPVLSLFLVLVIFALIELCLRLFSYGFDMHLFTDSRSETEEEYLMVNPHVGEKYFTRFEATTGTGDMFLRKKPENGYRIFMLGSSTIFGYPYDFNLMASRILQQRLQDAYPELVIEVVNTSITAINSITLKDFARQALKYEPDALLIYAGHNEFYGAFGIGSNETMSRRPFIVSAHLGLSNLRIYQLMRSAIGAISRANSRFSEENESQGTLMKQIVQDEEILYQGEIYSAGMEQYRKNLDDILKKAEKRQVPVYLSDLVSNVRDLPPFGDEKGAGLSAHNSFKEAQSHLAGGDTLEARSLFYEAKDLDPIRFRAPEEINTIIYELAEKYNAILVPAREKFMDESPGRLIGNTLLTEHVHPNIDGQFMLADAFFTSMTGSGRENTLPEPSNPISKNFYRSNWDYTELDSLMGHFKIEYLKSHWPFVPLEAKFNFRDTFRTSGFLDSLAFSILTDARASFQSLHHRLARHYEQEDEMFLAMKEYRALIRSNPYHSRYYTMAGSCMLKQNDLFASEKYLKESLKRGRDLFAYSLLAEIETVKHNFRDAAELYRGAVELVGSEKMDNDEAEAVKLDLNRKLSRAESLALNSGPVRYSEYTQFVPRDIEENYKRALALTSLDPDSALIYLHRSLEINDCPLVNYRIGDILYYNRDVEAMQYYDKAYKGFARDPDFLIRYCVSCLYNQEVNKAKEIYHFLALIAPQHPELPQLKKAVGD